MVPLWIEHTTSNEDELLRLTHLGLKSTEENNVAADLGDLRYTRWHVNSRSLYCKGQIWSIKDCRMPLIGIFID